MTLPSVRRRSPQPAQELRRSFIVSVFHILALYVISIFAYSVEAQTAASDDPLQQLVEAQQAALGSNDPEQVFQSSRDLAAFTLRLLAASNLQSNHPADASEHYAQSLSIQDSPDTRLDLAAVSLLRNEPAQALSEIDKVLALQPSNALALRLRGQALLSTRDDLGAIKALEQSVRLTPDLQTELLLLNAHLARGQASEANRLVQQLVERNGDSARLHLAVASSFQQASDLTGAIREATRAVSLDPASRDAHLALGTAFWELNEYQYNTDTLEQFTEAQRLDPSGYLSNFELGSVESQWHLFDQADKHLHAAIAADPASPDAWLQLGFNAYEQEKPADAQANLEHFVALSKQRPSSNVLQLRRALLLLSRLAAEDGRDADAAKLTSEAAQIQAHLGTGSSGIAPNQSVGLSTASPPPSTARQPASTGSPSTAPSAEIAARDGQFKEIIAKSLNDMGTVLARKRDYAHAIIPFRYAAQADAQLYPVMRNLGLAAYHTEAFDESRRAFSQAISDHPEDSLSRAYLGMSLFALLHFQQAAEVFRSSEPAISSNVLFAPTYALALTRSAQSGEAENVLARLLASAPPPEVQLSAAEAYLELGEANRSEAIARDVLSTAPNTPRTYMTLGRALLQQGKNSLAADQLRIALTTPETPLAGQEIKVLLAQALNKTGRHAEATSIITDLKRQLPGYSRAQLKRGEDLLHAGAFYAALASFEAAETLDPQLPQLQAQLSQARHQVGSQAQ